MGDKLSVVYVKILGFDKTFKNFECLNNLYCEKKLNKKSINYLFRTMGKCLTFYVRIIKQDQRVNGISLSYPTEVLKYAAEHNQIKDAEIWLEYIKEYNVYYQEKNRKNKQKCVNYMTRKYHNHIYSMLDYVHSEDKENYIKWMKPIEENLYTRKITLDDSIPVYSHKTIGISKRSYEIIMNYFKSQPLIKNVWLHGSRLFGTGTNGSDLDLIIDCPLENFKSINNDLYNLKIPYYIDCKNLYSPKSRFFIAHQMSLGNRKIYHAGDLQTYWDHANSDYNNINNVNLSKLL